MVMALGGMLLAVLSATPEGNQLTTSILGIGLGAPRRDVGAPSPEHNVICFSTENEPGNIIKLTIRAKDISEKIIGIGFTMLFLPTAVEFKKFQPGDFFERGGKPLYLVRDAPGLGVVVGTTLTRNDNFQSGSGTLISLYFHILRPQNPVFAFSRTVASTLQKGARKNLRTVEWLACN